MKHDIIVLSETLTNVPVSVPGFHAIQQIKENANHGGVALLVKNALQSELICTDMTCEEIVQYLQNNSLYAEVK